VNTPAASQDKVLDYEAAAATVREQARSVLASNRTDSERVELLAAQGRVLAAPVLADRDQPPFNRSTRDGFACRAAELTSGRPLRVIGQIRAGESWTARSPGEFEAIEIMTGAPLPAELDSVVMIEHVTVSTIDSQKAILPNRGRTLHAGENVVPAGAEARHGDVIVPAGTRLTASQIGASASCGFAFVEVQRRPNVGILATGDELVKVGATPARYQVRNSNSYSLAAQVSGSGGEPVILPIARDEPAETEAAIRSASHCDLLLLSGGVSMGKYDFVEEALARIGAAFFFTGVKIQPGKPVVFGRFSDSGKYFFGLPGNPISTLVTFLLFVQPMLSALGGADNEGPRFIQAQLAEDVVVKTGLTRFLPARLDANFLRPRVSQIRWQGSGDLASGARANCFLVVPSDRERLSAGDTVNLLLS
jgi:molybdopterin molybdotransferase